MEFNDLSNVEAEQSILGSIILDKHCIELVGDLREHDFSKEYNKEIFEVMVSLHKQKKAIDLITISNELKIRKTFENVGGVGYLTQLSTIVPTTTNLGNYIDIVKDLSNKRKIIKEAYTLVENLSEGKDIDSSMALFEKGSSVEKNNEISGSTLEDIMPILLDKLESNKEDKIKTGIKIIDKHTGGIGKKELVTIGAGSGMGKSAAAMIIALKALEQDKKVLIVSREMSKEQVAERILLSKAAIEKQKYENREFNTNDWQRIVKVISSYSTDQLVIDDKTSTIAGIKKEIRRVKPDLIIIDYVQLLTPSNIKDSRERQVAELSRGLRNITLDFDVSVIQLTQLAEKGTGNWRPKGESYTRESRAIYHDSNVVIYLHRVTEEKELEKARKRTIFEERGSLEDMKTTIDSFDEKGVKFTEIIVDKNRSGTTGSDYMWFAGADLNYYPIV